MRRSLLVAAGLAVLLGAGPGLTPAPRAARPSGKAMVTRTPVVEELLSAGRLRLVEEYNAKAGARAAGIDDKLLVFGSEEDLALAQGASTGGRGRRPVVDKIFLRRRTIDTSRPRVAPPPPAVRRGRLELIQFHGPVKKAWLERLRDAGSARPLAYVPDNAYIAWVEDSRSLEAAGLPLQWREEFDPLDRLSPDLQSGPDPVTVTVQVARVGDHEGLLAEIRSRALSVLMEPRDIGPVTNIRVTLPPEAIEDLALRPEVMWVEPFERPETHDERSDLISAGLVANTRPLGPGYLSWLASRGLDDLSGAIVDITDTGIDTGGTEIAHPGLRGRIAYSVDRTDEGRLDDCAGHGTNIAGIVAGGAQEDPALLDEEGYLYGLGMAPTVRVGATRIFNCLGAFVPAVPFTDLVAGAYERGARIGNNSWGGIGNHYNSVDAEYDAVTRDANRDPSDGDQEFLAVFSIGNKGPALLTASWPGTAKNVLSVGATESYRPTGSDGCGTGPGLADSVDHVLSFGSRGPTADGRLKPDLVAPGSHIQSLASGAPGFVGNGVCDRYHPPGQRLVNWTSGTSQAAAHVTGAAAIAAEVYRRLYGVAPSPAMIKAMLINHAHDMGTSSQLPSNTLNRPNVFQGWGRLDIGALIDANARLASDQQSILTETGETVLFDPVVVEDPNEPVIATLVWTDAPGTPSSSAWVNDLDLVVESEGTTYLGNFIDRGVSVPGGVADYRNNVEEVVLPPGARTLRITVEAANLAGDGLPSITGETDQDFALYASNVRLATSRGEIAFARQEAICGSASVVRLTDLGLRGFGRAGVAVESGGDRETMLLHETPAGTARFEGAIDVAGGAPHAGDGVLQTADGLEIRAIYTEQDPASGLPVERTATIVGHCAPPAISAPTVTRSGDLEAVIAWHTDRASDSAVQFGLGTNRTSIKADTLPVTDHVVRLGGLTPCSTYTATLSSTDTAGFSTSWSSPPLRFSTGPGQRGRRVILRDDMEDLGSRWTHSALRPGAADDWELGFPAASPLAGFSGTRAWGTNLDGNYSVGADSALMSPPVDLRDAVGAQLTFMHYYSIPGGRPPVSLNDGAWVEVTADGGATWSAIDPVGGYPEQIDRDNPYLPGASPVFAGFTPSWTRATFDLSAYSGQLIRVRFHLWQDALEGVPTSAGWYIDDVEVSAQGACHEARLRLDAEEYGCSSRAKVLLSESDLNLSPTSLDTARVTATSGSGQIEVVLTETAVNSGEFRGVLALRPSPDPGSLVVTEGSTITATYVDQNSGDGTPATLTASSLVADCTPPPAPTGVSASTDGGGSLAISWVPVDAGVAPDLQGYRIHYDVDGSGPTYLGTGAFQGASPVRVESTTASAHLTSLIDCSHHFITVTAFDRFGNESAFAPESVAVPTGTVPCAAARLTAGPANTGCSGTLAVTLLDSNADPDTSSQGSVVIAASSPSQNGTIAVPLVETTASSGMFTGSLPLSPSPKAGFLAVAEGDLVSLRYVDLDDGRGNGREAATGITVADCTTPTISNVRVTGRAGNRAVVRWDTDEPGTSSVRYGFDPSLGLTASAPAGTPPGLSHAVPLAGLSPCTTVYFAVSSADERGNLATQPASGSPLRFGTYREQPIYGDDFEAGATGWTHASPGSGSDEWELGTPDPSEPGGPPTAYSGSSLWGTDLNGFYEQGADMVLVSPPLDLIEAESATLTFKHWYDIAAAGPPGQSFDDGGFLEARVDGSATWIYLTPQGGYPDVMAPNPYTQFGAGAYAGTSPGWVTAAFTLDQFIGKVIRVRFHFVQDETDFNVPRAGWYIDDVSLSLGVACHEGRVEMDRASYACVGQSVRLSVFDADLDLDDGVIDAATARVTSDAEPTGENVVLSETGPSTGIFEGTVPIATADSPGTLRVQDADTIVSTYDDANDGTGQSRVVSSSASVPDCAPPLLSAVHVVAAGPDSFRVEWLSSEPSDSRVLLGTTPALGGEVVVPGLRTVHSVTAVGLDACTPYVYTVASTDAGGNLARDDAVSGLRTVRTSQVTNALDETFDTGSPGWRHAGEGDTWVITGSGRAMTAPSGAYSRRSDGVSSDFVLTSPPIDLAGIANPQLTFSHSFDFATGYQGGDGGWLEAWNGLSWVKVTPTGDYPGLLDPEAGRTGLTLPGYSGTSGPSMTAARFDLAGIAQSLAGSGVEVTRIRFRVFVDGGIGATGAGWIVDDVKVSGDIPCRLGRLSFGTGTSPCAPALAPLTLADRDLDLDPNAVDSATVLVESTGSTQPLQVTVVESAPSSSSFAGAVPLGSQGDPGTLRAAPGDIITAAYDDADDGTGAARRVTASIRGGGCSGPVIGRIAMVRAGGDDLLIRWSTDRPATSEVSLESASGTPLSASDHRLVTSHYLKVHGLSDCASYTVSIASEDIDGLRSTSGGTGGGLVIENGRREILFADDMEGIDPGWTTSGFRTEWERGVPGAGPDHAFSGTQVFGTDLNGLYEAGTNATLTSPPIDLTGVTEARLTFWHWYDLFANDPPNSQDDAAWVEVLAPGNLGPTYVEPIGGYPDTCDADNGQPLLEGTAVYAGQSVEWEPAVFDLTPFAGKVITLRFRLWNDMVELILNGRTGYGWYIDDLEVSTSRHCFPAPSISSFSLPAIDQGASAVNVTVTGTGFRTGASVSAGAGIEVTSATVVSSLQIGLDITVDPRSPLGARDVSVVNPDGQTAVLSGALRVLVNRRRADADGSGRVDGTDLAILAGAFASAEGEPGYLPAADLNGDGIVDGTDLALLAASFGISF